MQTTLQTAPIALRTAPPSSPPAHPPENRKALAQLRQAAIQVLGHANFEETIQLSRRGGLALVAHQGELKVFKLINCHADWKKRWGRRVGWNPARSALRMSRAMQAAGLPLCSVERHGRARLPGAPRAVWTLSRYTPNARTLRQVTLELQPHRRAPVNRIVRRLYEDALALLRRIHDAGFEHRDYHAGNLLVAPADADSLESAAARMSLVDLETVVARAATPARRARDLRRIIENYIEPGSTRADVEYAVDVYAAGNAALAGQIMATRRMAGLLAKCRAA